MWEIIKTLVMAILSRLIGSGTKDTQAVNEIRKQRHETEIKARPMPDSIDELVDRLPK